MTHHISNNTVAVADDYYWQPMDSCPRGVKVQLLGEGGVAAYGVVMGKSKFWQGWAPLPKRRQVVQAKPQYTTPIAEDDGRRYQPLLKRYEDVRSLCLQFGGLHPDDKSVCHQALKRVKPNLLGVGHALALLADDMALALVAQKAPITAAVINSADIRADDLPHVIVEKLNAAIARHPV